MMTKTATQPSKIAVGDDVLLLGADGRRFIVRARNETVRVAGLGVLALGDLVGRPWGDTVRLGLADYALVPPRVDDYARSFTRGPQIITPKDASRIVYETGAGAGDRILEAGAGSGVLTAALAHAVAPTGRVVALDIKPAHLEVAKKNVEGTPWKACVEFREGDVRKGVPERDLDAIVLDIPDSESAIAALAPSLRLGGVIALYCPTVEQANRAAAAAVAAGFGHVKTLELIERGWTLHDRGSRPDFEMLGHTGFLTFARRLQQEKTSKPA